MGEYPGISLCYSLLTTSHLSNFTLWVPHTLLARDSGLRGLASPIGCGTFGRNTSKVPWLRHAEGSSPPPRPPTCLRLSFLTGKPEGPLLHSLRLPPSAWSLHSPDTKRDALIISFIQNLRTRCSKDLRTEVMVGGDPPEQPGRGRRYRVPNTLKCEFACDKLTNYTICVFILWVLNMYLIHTFTLVIRDLWQQISYIRSCIVFSTSLIYFRFQLLSY